MKVAISYGSKAASPMLPVAARQRAATWSSSFGHSTPGVSESEKPRSRSTRCRRRVTAGRSATSATRRPFNVLMSVDLPTFGMPTTSARTGLPGPVRPGTSSRHSAGMRATPLRSAARIATARAPVPVSRPSQRSVTDSSARSALLSARTHGRSSRSSSSIGFALASGRRASSTSITTSVSRMAAAISRRALFMCPGNQLIVIGGSA